MTIAMDGSLSGGVALFSQIYMPITIFDIGTIVIKSRSKFNANQIKPTIFAPYDRQLIFDS